MGSVAASLAVASSSACSRSFSTTKRTAASTLSASAGSSRSAGSCTIAVICRPRRSRYVTPRPLPSAGSGTGVPAPSTYAPAASDQCSTARLGSRSTVRSRCSISPGAGFWPSSMTRRPAVASRRSVRSCPVMKPTGTMRYFFAAFSSRLRAPSRAASSSKATRLNRARAFFTCALSWMGSRRRPRASMYAKARSGSRARFFALSRAMRQP